VDVNYSPGRICRSKNRLKEIQKTSFSSPEIPQDDDSDHEGSQRDGVTDGVDEIQAVEDILLEEGDALDGQNGFPYLCEENNGKTHYICLVMKNKKGSRSLNETLIFSQYTFASFL